MNNEERQTSEMHGDVLAKLLESYAETHRNRPKFHFLPDLPPSVTELLNSAFAALASESGVLACGVLRSLLTEWFDEEDCANIRGLIPEEYRSWIQPVEPTRTLTRCASHPGIEHQFVISGRTEKGHERQLLLISCRVPYTLDYYRDGVHELLAELGFPLSEVACDRSGEALVSCGKRVKMPLAANG